MSDPCRSLQFCSLQVLTRPPFCPLQPYYLWELVGEHVHSAKSSPLCYLPQSQRHGLAAHGNRKSSASPPPSPSCQCISLSKQLDPGSQLPYKMLNFLCRTRHSSTCGPPSGSEGCFVQGPTTQMTPRSANLLPCNVSMLDASLLSSRAPNNSFVSLSILLMQKPL